MSATVRILPSGHEFEVQTNEPILEAGLRSGIALEFGCVNGTCGECKARVKEGEVRQIRFYDYVVTDSEKNSRTVLLCSCTADSDVTVEATEAGGPDDIPAQKVRARVYKQLRVDDAVGIVHLRVMRGRVLRFLAGQHVRLGLAGSEATDIAIASCPCDGLNLEFHFDLREQNDLGAMAFTGLKKSDRFEIEGPGGRFTLDESSERPLVFIAFDSAIAPIKSIIEHAVNLELPQAMYLHWHSTRENGHYLHNYFRSLTDALDELQYVPNFGTVTANTLSELPDLALVDAYLAGSKELIRGAKELMLQRGLPEERLFIDALGRRPSSILTAD